MPGDTQSGALGPTVPGADVIAGRPDGDARVNWSSPLARGLVTAVCDQSGNLVDQSSVSYVGVTYDHDRGLIYDRTKSAVITYPWLSRPTAISAQVVLPPVTSEQSQRGMCLIQIGSANNRLELWLQNDNLVARKYHDNKLQTTLSESAAIHLHGYNVMGVTYTISGRLRIYADGYQIGQKYGPFSPLDSSHLGDPYCGIGGDRKTHKTPDRIILYLQHDRELARDEMRDLGADPYSVIAAA